MITWTKNQCLLLEVQPSAYTDEQQQLTISSPTKNPDAIAVTNKSDPEVRREMARPYWLPCSLGLQMTYPEPRLLRYNQRREKEQKAWIAYKQAGNTSTVLSLLLLTHPEQEAVKAAGKAGWKWGIADVR